jgi:hypothetical protein
MIEFNRASMRPRTQVVGIIVDELLVLVPDIEFENSEQGMSLKMPEFWCWTSAC